VTARSIAVWLALYLALSWGRQAMESWLLARFQRRSGRGRALDLHLGLSWHARGKPRGELPDQRLRATAAVAAQTAAAIAALLTGAMIPVAPGIDVSELLGNTDMLLLFALALNGLGMGMWLLGVHLAQSRSTEMAAPAEAARLLRQALPAATIVLSLIITGSALDSGHESSLDLAGLIDVQGKWHGLRWLGFLQPLSLLLWMACTQPRCPHPQGRATWIWQALALNWTLLTSTLFLGGWQGPLVEQFGWLGLPYALIKLGTITCMWTWISASLPRSDPLARSRGWWPIAVALASANLLLSAAICVGATPGGS
jgi:NADH:ubiquinone oxidoreductase subunit H